MLSNGISKLAYEMKENGKVFAIFATVTIAAMLLALSALNGKLKETAF